MSLRHVFYLWANTILLAVPAAADSHWPNGCDAKADLETCQTLMILYEHGPGIFPKDPARVQALRIEARAATQIACLAGKADACGPLIGFIMDDPEIGTDEKIAQARSAFAAMETRCRAGEALMCGQRVFLSYASPVLRLRDDIIATQGAEAWRGMFGDTDAWAEISQEVHKSAKAAAMAGCSAGDAEACVRAAYLHAQNSTAMTVDLTIMASFPDLCLAGNHTACDMLTFSTPKLARDMPDRLATMSRTMAEACAAGNGPACSTVSRFIKDAARRDDIREQACDNGLGASCASIGFDRLRTWERSDVPDATALQTAVDYLTRGCELGDVMACHALEHISQG